MVRLERSALMGFASAELLTLVQDIARYPEFMPGCVGATVGPVNDGSVEAGLRFRFAGLTESFHTENRVSSNETHTTLQMKLLRGPFKHLVGEWRFQPLGEAACKVSLAIELDWGALSLGRLLSPQIDHAVGSVMQAFKTRAEQLYGKHCATA